MHLLPLLSEHLVSLSITLEKALGHTKIIVDPGVFVGQDVPASISGELDPSAAIVLEDRETRVSLGGS